MTISMNALLSDATVTWLILGIVIAAVVCLAIGWLVGYFVYSNVREKKIGETKSVVKKMLDDAQTESKQLKKEAIIEAKEQELKLRNDFEREAKEKRAEMQKLESRLNQKDDILNKKEINLIKRNDELEQTRKELDNYKREIDKKGAEVDKRSEQVEKQQELMTQELEKVAQLSQEEAKAQLVELIKDDARKEAAVFVRNQEAQAKEEAEKKAKNLISLAVQRCCTDHASEITVSVVPLPNDDMKARIIGREGRNIRALENATGIEFVIDDTPEVVILSGFDPVRREVARLALEKLVSDGRIHPASIEDTVEKVRKELDVKIKETGEAAMFDAGLYGIHPELIKLLGRLKYRTSYGQNVLQHSLEVSAIAGLMAQELGCDVNLAKRGGLLHDIGKAVDHEVEGTHIQIGTDLARKYKESNKVINCIQAHHGDVEPTTIEAVLVQAADAISGARPGARRETTTNYVKRLEKLESIGQEFKGVDKCYAIQAGREIRVIVKPDQIDDAKTLFLAKDIAKKIEEELEYPGQIKVNVIREYRSVEYAK
ncbi:MAG: ribonuclease Y [Christensenellaceae bacterium]|nr:ribonuclease Y [Christensenellaceae bacterium]MDY2851247.1 ribonuclease Y [Christensenellaceae bacterium]